LKPRLTHKERVKLSIAHKEPDRIPVAMVCSVINKPAYKNLEEYLKKTRSIGVEEYLEPVIDIKGVAPVYIGPKLEPGFDYWGVKREFMTFGEDGYQEITKSPLLEISSIDQLKKYPWPSPDWFDFKTVLEQITKINSKEEFGIIAGPGNIFESSWYMRGFEQSFMDMVLDPEILHFIMDKAANFYIEYSNRFLSAGKGKIDLYFTADDLGGQQGLLLSAKMWEEFIKPYHVKLNKAIHNYGAKVIYHTDGAVMELVPGLMEMGIDVLQALQFDAAGMDPLVLKEKYGNKLCFEGGISVQSTLPFGTAEDVKNETLERARVLGKNGGYLLGPSHCIQAGTPPENIIALFDTAQSIKY